MKRQGGHYGGDSGGGHHAYGGGAAAQSHNQWRWERDAPPHDKMPQPMSPTPPYAQGQGRDATRSSYQNQRMDLRAPFENQGDGDRRSQPHEEYTDRVYEDNQGSVQTFEGLERKFLDDILKLSKEQADAEDAENARHRERINTINAQYEVQLAALRANHTNRREEFLQRESQARQQQYKQLAMDQYPTSRVVTPSDPRGYNADTAPPSGEEPSRAYKSDYYNSYRERGRFHGHDRDHGYESKVPYPRGRSYDAGSRYY